MSAAAPLIRRHRHSVDEYHRMAETGILKPDERVELIEGEIIDMPPIGTDHSAVVKRLNAMFMRNIGTTAIVSVQDPIRLAPNSEPQPDIALLRYREDFYCHAHPGPADILLLIEVADTSLRFDQEIKLPLYARHGVPEVWIVDLGRQRIEVYRRPLAGRYLETLYPQRGELVAPEGWTEFGVEWGELF